MELFIFGGCLVGLGIWMLINMCNDFSGYDDFKNPPRDVVIIIGLSFLIGGSLTLVLSGIW